MPAEDRIPLIKADLPSFDDVAEEFSSALSSGQVTNFGANVREFEKEAGDYLGTQAATLSSGTLALLLTLEALGPVRGRRVVLPSFTFVATAQAILYAGGRPEFCDIQEDFTLSPNDLEKILADRSEEIAAVVPVHVYGMPASVDDISSIVEEASDRIGQSIPVIYDAAHAFGSSVNGRKVGTFGSAEVFSLSVTKALVSIEGGMVTSADGELIERIKKMRNYGIGENYESFFPGMNGKMSELHAIVGRANLARLDRLMGIRGELAKKYFEALETTPYETIPVPKGATHTYKDFTVLVPNHLASRRDEVRHFLADEGIETRSYFWPPVHTHRMFSSYSERDLPLTESLGSRVITLPFFTSMTTQQIDRVVDVLVRAEKKLS